MSSGFEPINPGYDRVFRWGRLSIGLVVPLEAYPESPVPTMERHLQRVQLAETLGFAAVWLRDVPFNVPSFGDAGQRFDPFVYLGALTTTTRRIALGVASIILPLRHPAHVAKAAASVDELSGGRLILGVASGDRPTEYPAMNVPFADRGVSFRESFEYIRNMQQDTPSFENRHGSPRGIDMLPKPFGARLPMLVTGGSQQDPAWVAQNGDGWMTYPRVLSAQARVVRDYLERTEGRPKPVMQPLYVDLDPDPDAPARPIHLGFRSGVRHLYAYLAALEELGVSHVALNLRFNRLDIEDTLARLSDALFPRFASPAETP